jgi:hypothetical protein
MGRPSIVSVGNSGPVLLATIPVGSLPFTSGPLMLEARRLKNWLFTLGGTFTAFSVLVQGTNDANTSGFIGYPNTPPNANWFTLFAESAQGGTGVEANPLLNISQSLSYDRSLYAVRIVATNLGGATGTALVFGSAWA